MHGWNGWRQESPPNTHASAFVLGELTATTRDLGRQVAELRTDHKALKSEVDKLRTWAERAAILVALYLLGTGLHWSAGTMGPVMATLVRAAVSGLRGG